MTETLFERTNQQKNSYSIPKEWPELDYNPPSNLCRKNDAPLPQASELQIMRHFSELAHKNVGIDNIFYPLGSCTMKYNPRINEVCANLQRFAASHPLAPADSVQGNLQIIIELLEMLCDICGMDGGTLLPNAGSQGEFVGLKLICAYHANRNDSERREVLIPDTAHGTNPATAAMCGLKIVNFKSNAEGGVDIEELKKLVSSKTAALMLTNPNTLGLFSPQILEIAALVHEAGGLLYYDGANLNPLLNIARPGDMGFDVMHINLHKTFSTPHGGGGPGSGPVLCNIKLQHLLPTPSVIKIGDRFDIKWEDPESIGAIATFHGNFGIYLRAYVYAKLHGHYGLRKVAENAVLNANYLKKRLSSLFTIPYSQHCMHEFVLQADNYLDKGIKALDIAKRLLDYDVYAPTIYFPLIVKECMLVEPTETESKETLDRFVDILASIIEEISHNPEIVKTAPHTKSVSRLNEVHAAKNPILKHPK